MAWDAATGKPVSRAIVWQDDRTKDVTERLKADGAEDLTLARAGLPLDPYFSASKMRWIIDHVADARPLLKAGRLRIATSDAFFLDRLTGEYATDVTTASRTSLMSLDTLGWDEDLLKLFGVPREVLPEIRDTTGPFGAHKGVPVTASLVDQQAALFGHGCAGTGDAKITFGTGAFALGIAGQHAPAAERLGPCRHGRLARTRCRRRFRARRRGLQCRLGGELGAQHRALLLLRRDQQLCRIFCHFPRALLRACPLGPRLPALGPQRRRTLDRSRPRHDQGRHDAGPFWKGLHSALPR